MLDWAASRTFEFSCRAFRSLVLATEVVSGGLSTTFCRVPVSIEILYFAIADFGLEARVRQRMARSCEVQTCLKHDEEPKIPTVDNQQKGIFIESSNY
jgi:hypothetical protein